VRIIKWTKPANLDLDDICEYIFQDNPEAAVDVILTIIEKVEPLLPTNLAIGRPGRISGTRELIMPKLPYLVVYWVKDEQIEILRIIHEARKWPPA